MRTTGYGLKDEQAAMARWREAPWRLVAYRFAQNLARRLKPMSMETEIPQNFTSAKINDGGRPPF